MNLDKFNKYMSEVVIPAALQAANTPGHPLYEMFKDVNWSEYFDARVQRLSGPELAKPR